MEILRWSLLIYKIPIEWNPLLPWDAVKYLQHFLYRMEFSNIENLWIQISIKWWGPGPPFPRGNSNGDFQSIFFRHQTHRGCEWHSGLRPLTSSPWHPVQKQGGAWRPCCSNFLRSASSMRNSSRVTSCCVRSTEALGSSSGNTCRGEDVET